MSVALAVFHQLCNVATALEQLREQHAPASDDVVCPHRDFTGP